MFNFSGECILVPELVNEVGVIREEVFEVINKRSINFMRDIEFIFYNFGKYKPEMWDIVRVFA